jgi:hypothetical protein
MKPGRVIVVLAATALVGCSAQTHDAAPAPTATSVTSIAAVPAAATIPVVTPTTTPRVTPTQAPTVAPPPHATTKPRPTATRKATPKPTGWVCVLNQPCQLPPLTSPVWKVTHGCTSAWRTLMHTDTCPAGQPRLP